MPRHQREVALYCHNCHPCSKHSVSGCYPTIFQYRGCPFESIFGKRRFFYQNAPYLLLVILNNPCYNLTLLQFNNSTKNSLVCTRAYVCRVYDINNYKGIVYNISVDFLNTLILRPQKGGLIVLVFEKILYAIPFRHLFGMVLLSVPSAMNTTVVVPYYMEEFRPVFSVDVIEKYASIHHAMPSSIYVFASFKFNHLPIGDVVQFLAVLSRFGYYAFSRKTLDNNVHPFPWKIDNICNSLLSDIRHALFCPHVVALVKVCVYSSYTHDYCNILQFFHKFTKRPILTFVLVRNLKDSIRYIFPVPCRTDLGERISVDYGDKRRTSTFLSVVFGKLKEGASSGFRKKITSRAVTATKKAHYATCSRIIKGGISVPHFDGNIKGKGLVRKACLNVASHAIQYNVVNLRSCHSKRVLINDYGHLLKKETLASHRENIDARVYDRRLSPVSVNDVTINLPKLDCGAKIQPLFGLTKYGKNGINN